MDAYNINPGLRMAQYYENKASQKTNTRKEFERALDICKNRTNTKKILKMSLSIEFRDLARLAIY